ncbi:4-coumarate--CoA ligase 1-like isoform X1 [Colias croceus]|uniref:4-coumarate--CoA ligase 1-like isoform X1 n=2 Tax=Colias crocea TaxID=72248 RepID=UPI001E27EED0|nr:4-coumarate--CoA ligase 1-like isoform X1 [Colias croceus]
MSSSDLYVYGDRNIQVPAHLHFGKYLLDRLRNVKDTDALINADSGERITYKELTQRAVNLASELMKLGVRRGDIVALGTEKRNEIAPTVLAVLLTGAAYTAYDVQIGKSSLKHKLSVARPNYFIHSKLFWERYNDVLLTSDNIENWMTFDDGLQNASCIETLMNSHVDIEYFEPTDVKGQTDVALILYSSGTTGLPKGVRLTHLNCILNSTPYNLDYGTMQRFYTCGEWYHNYDTFSMYKYISLGKTIVYLTNIKPENLVKCIKQYKIDMAMILPILIYGLCKVDDTDYHLESLKLIYSRSAPLHYRTIENVKQRFPNLQEVFQGYGMTECGELTSENWGTKGPKPGSVGMASPGIVLKVTDPNTGRTLGPNERGEIRAKGPVLMKGYIGIDPSTYLDEDGFLKTGDLGYYDDDRYFYIVDRIKEILCYDGDQVPPLELETILQLHPDVLEVGVVGKHSEEHGDIPTAFVVTVPGSKVTEQELINYVAGEVPPFMQLAGGVKFITKLPRNPRGKILRRELREILNN